MSSNSGSGEFTNQDLARAVIAINSVPYAIARPRLYSKMPFTYGDFALFEKLRDQLLDCHYRR